MACAVEVLAIVSNDDKHRDLELSWIAGEGGMQWRSSLALNSKHGPETRLVNVRHASSYGSSAPELRGFCEARTLEARPTALKVCTCVSGVMLHNLVLYSVIYASLLLRARISHTAGCSRRATFPSAQDMDAGCGPQRN